MVALLAPCALCGSANLEINHNLDKDTDLRVNMQPGADNMGANVDGCQLR